MSDTVLKAESKRSDFPEPVLKNNTELLANILTNETLP